MPVFKDARAREWPIVVSVGGIKRVKEATGINVAGLLSDGNKPLADLLGDPALFCTVCFHLVPAAGRPLEDEFADAIDGEALDRLGEAFIAALMDFFPRQKAALTRLMNKSRQVAESKIAKATAALDAVTVEQIEAAFEKPNGPATKSTPGAGSSPESAVLLPAS